MVLNVFENLSITPKLLWSPISAFKSKILLSFKYFKNTPLYSLPESWKIDNGLISKDSNASNTLSGFLFLIGQAYAKRVNISMAIKIKL